MSDKRRRVLFWLPALILGGVILTLLLWPEKAGLVTMALLLLAVAIAAIWTKEKGDPQP